MFHPNGPTFWELARQAMSSTQAGYDLLARKFDFTPYRTPDWILAEAAKVIETIGPFETALDVCCGTGAAMQMLVPFCQQSISGIDFSRGMLDVARGNLRSLDYPSFNFHLGNVLQMDFEAEFDLLVSFSAFGHIRRRQEAELVRRIARALRPGGRFVFATGQMPALFSREYLLSRGFNAAMRIRNCVWRPKFIMYYLTFLWPDVKLLLQRQGFQVETHFVQATGRQLVIVVATKPLAKSTA